MSLAGGCLHWGDRKRLRSSSSRPKAEDYGRPKIVLWSVDGSLRERLVARFIWPLSENVL